VLFYLLLKSQLGVAMIPSFLLRVFPARLAGAMLVLLAVTSCQSAQKEEFPMPLAPASPVTLAPADYKRLPAGATVTWRDLNTGKIVDEHIGEATGLLIRSVTDGRHSFAYLPDPWADNENTVEAEINPSFNSFSPIAVGNKVSFNRRPGIITVDTMEVVRAETLTLHMGKVDTFVIETKSGELYGKWWGESTFWYAPSLHWYVQFEIRDSDGDNRRRQAISIREP
jgi:hypothetical protein